jgi:alkyl hydroperoxide reductase subunit D
MSLDSIKQALPAYAKDLKLNLSSVLNDPALRPDQAWGSALASAIASRNGELTSAMAEAAAAHLSSEAATAAKAAAAVMGMNNIYYRFVHLAGHEGYRSMPAKLRMNVIANPGVDKVDFELWSLAVSAVNGCGLCIEAHERELQAKGISHEAIQAAVRIAAVIHGLAVVLDGEASLGARFDQAA